MSGMDDLELRPAVLVLDDGAKVELPDLTIGEALEVVRIAAEFGELVGGEIDAARVRGVATWGVDDERGELIDMVSVAHEKPEEEDDGEASAE